MKKSIKTLIALLLAAVLLTLPALAAETGSATVVSGIILGDAIGGGVQLPGVAGILNGGTQLSDANIIVLLDHTAQQDNTGSATPTAVAQVGAPVNSTGAGTAQQQITIQPGTEAATNNVPSRTEPYVLVPTNTIFINNTNILPDPVFAYNVSFTSNTAINHGGAIYIGSKTGIPAYIIDNGTGVGTDANSLRALYTADPGYAANDIMTGSQYYTGSSDSRIIGTGNALGALGVEYKVESRVIRWLTGAANVVLNSRESVYNTPVVIKEGRTFSPAGAIADLLGVRTAWNSETKTATFIN